MYIHVSICHCQCAVTVKSFELLLDQGCNWYDFDDFKHDYSKKVYRSNVCFVSCGPWTDGFAVTECDIVLTACYHWLTTINSLTFGDKKIHWKYSSPLNNDVRDHNTRLSQDPTACTVLHIAARATKLGSGYSMYRLVPGHPQICQSMFGSHPRVDIKVFNSLWPGDNKSI